MGRMCNRHPNRPAKKGRKLCYHCAWLRKNWKRVPENLIAHKLRRLRQFGLNAIELQRARVALESFNGLCQLCGRETKGAVDHCHTTKVFRGILCTYCNSYLAFIKENPEISDRVSAYLRKYRNA